LEGKKKNHPARDYRKFGLSVGGMLCVLAGLLYWRDHLQASLIPACAGGLLIFAGFLHPPLLKLPYRGWMRFAYALGWFNTRLILILAFYLIITPTGVLMRLLGKRPLALKWDKRASSYWIPREKEPFEPRRYEKHF